MAETANQGAVCEVASVKSCSMSKLYEKIFSNSKRRMSKFWNCESGSFTVEAMIWIPMFFFLMIFALNVSMVFVQESLILRVVQTVSREHSLGLYRDDAEAELDLSNQLSHLGANVTVDVSKSFKMATASVQVPAVDLMPMQFLRNTFSGVEIDVTSNHLVEF